MALPVKVIRQTSTHLTEEPFLKYNEAVMNRKEL